MAIILTGNANTASLGSVTTSATLTGIIPNHGDAVLIAVEFASVTGSVSSVTDAAGSTYSFVAQATGTTGSHVELWGTSNYLGTGDSTWTIAVATGGAGWSAHGVAFSGVQSIGTATTAVGNSLDPSISKVTTNTGSLVFGAFAQASTSSWLSPSHAGVTTLAPLASGVVAYASALTEFGANITASLTLDCNTGSATATDFSAVMVELIPQAPNYIPSVYPDWIYRPVLPVSQQQASTFLPPIPATWVVQSPALQRSSAPGWMSGATATLDNLDAGVAPPFNAVASVAQAWALTQVVALRPSTGAPPVTTSRTAGVATLSSGTITGTASVANTATLEVASTASAAGAASLEATGTARIAGTASLEVTSTTRLAGATTLEATGTARLAAVSGLEAVATARTATLTSLEASSTSRASGITSLEATTASRLAGLSGLEAASVARAAGAATLEASATTSVAGLSTLEATSTARVASATSLVQVGASTQSVAGAATLEATATARTAGSAGLESTSTIRTAGLVTLDSQATTRTAGLATLDSPITTLTQSAAGQAILEATSTIRAAGVTTLETSNATRVASVAALEIGTTSRAAGAASLEAGLTVRLAGSAALEATATARAASTSALETTVTARVMGTAALEITATPRVAGVATLDQPGLGTPRVAATVQLDATGLSWLPTYPHKVYPRVFLPVTHQQFIAQPLPESGAVRAASTTALEAGQTSRAASSATLEAVASQRAAGAATLEGSYWAPTYPDYIYPQVSLAAASQQFVAQPLPADLVARAAGAATLDSSLATQVAGTAALEQIAVAIVAGAADLTVELTVSVAGTAALTGPSTGTISVAGSIDLTWEGTARAAGTAILNPLPFNLQTRDGQEQLLGSVQVTQRTEALHGSYTPPVPVPPNTVPNNTPATVQTSDTSQLPTVRGHAASTGTTVADGRPPSTIKAK